MNYKNYKTAVIETYAVQLIGWPSSIDFISPSNIGIIGDIRKLRDALKARTCYWAPLIPAEVKAHTAELDTRRSAGEVVRQPRKKRSDAGLSRKRKPLPSAKKDNGRPPKKAKGTRQAIMMVPKARNLSSHLTRKRLRTCSVLCYLCLYVVQFTTLG